MEGIFDTVEELTGHSPTSDTLRNAVHAIITKSMMNEMEHMDDGFLIGAQRATYLRQAWKNVQADHILGNVEYIAQSFEANRDFIDDEDRENCGIWGCLPPDPTNPAIKLCRCPNLSFDVDIWKD